MTEEQKEQMEVAPAEDNNQLDSSNVEETVEPIAEQVEEQVADAPETEQVNAIEETPEQTDQAEDTDEPEAELTDDSKAADEATVSDEPAKAEEVKDQQPPQETIVEASDDNDQDFEPTIESVIEAILFASDEPITPLRLAKITEVSIKELKKYVKTLNSKYRESQNSFRIEQIAGGLQMMTLPPYSHWLRKLIRVRGDSKLSPAALETLAIVAYRQPIIRADVETVRGVAAGEMIRSLMFKGLVKIAGRAEILGRPMLYGTTKKFLEIFGLNSLKDLPKIEELKKPLE